MTIKQKTLHLTRHAQAYHNVAEDWTIPDAKLTPLGKSQSRDLNTLTSSTYQQTAQLLVCSIMRRPLETMILGYPTLRARLESEGKPPIILDILQEANGHPCDTPTAPIEAIKNDPDPELRAIFKDLDFTQAEVDPGYASKKGIFDPKNLRERARRVRQFLYDREEEEIVVVAHGDILRLIADDDQNSRPWSNAENKDFTFASDDMSKPLKEIVKGDVEPRNATRGETSSEMA